jgi:dihydroflavonol-4-reductase
LGGGDLSSSDLAKLHVAALTAPYAPGKRFLATGGFLWMTDIARILREGLGERAAKVPRKLLPDWAARALALVMPQLRMFVGDLGQRRDVDASSARELLGFAPRPARETLLDCTETLLAAHVA